MNNSARVYPNLYIHSWHLRWNRGRVKSVDNTKLGGNHKAVQDTIRIQDGFGEEKIISEKNKTVQ